MSCSKNAIAEGPQANPLLGNALASLEAQIEASPGGLADYAYVDASLLCWLATHGGRATRRAVAADRRASARANSILAEDADEGVRSVLASKISWRMSAYKEGSPCHALTMKVVQRLARDPSPAVRTRLAQEICHLCTAPRAATLVLARDADLAVSGPILEYSPLLSDADLLQIILSGASSPSLVAIARRRPLGADICDAIALLLDPDPISTLLANPEANIRAEAIDHVARHARRVPTCMSALARRADLSPRAARLVERASPIFVRIMDDDQRPAFAIALTHAAF
jgi:uncharacterized protein (DUF2336 family)